MRTFEYEQAQKVVCDSAVVLGCPRTKARSLFSFEDKRSGSAR